MCFRRHASHIFAFPPVELIKSQSLYWFLFGNFYCPCLLAFVMARMLFYWPLEKIVCVISSIWYYRIPVAFELLVVLGPIAFLCCWFQRFGRWHWHSSCFLLLCKPIGFAPFTWMQAKKQSLLCFLWQWFSYSLNMKFSNEQWDIYWLSKKRP